MAATDWSGERGGERGYCCFTGIELRLRKMKRVLEISCPTMWMYQKQPNLTLQNAWGGKFYVICIFSSVQSLSHVQLFATPRTAVCQASLSIANFWSLLKLMSIELVMLSNHLILCRPLFLLPSWSFLMSQFFISGGQSIGVSASASVLPMNIQDWFPLGWTGGICLQSKGLSRVFSNTTVQKHQFFSSMYFTTVKIGL